MHLDFQQLLEWKANQIKRGCSNLSMYQQLLREGYNQHQVIKLIYEDKEPDFRYPFINIKSSFLHFSDGHVAEIVTHVLSPQIVVIKNFLADSECSSFIEMSRTSLNHSTVINKDIGSDDVIQNRTSKTSFLHDVSSPTLKMIAARIAELTNWPAERSELFQVQQYGIGGEYRSHHDFFPSGSGSVKAIGSKGQRLATLIMYLNNCEEGGETGFSDLGIRVAARKGNAVFFSYPNLGDGHDPRCLHAGLPVLAGEKWIATKWLRENAE
jgi:prolyl 4-hydroxylase